MKKDGSWSEFLSDPDRFADAINGFGCNGEQIVTAEDLREVDTQIRGVKMPKFVNRFSAEKTWGKSKFRDLAQKVAMGINFLIVGIEAQETIDYSIPLRNMEYDVGEYRKQAAKIQREVKKSPKGLEAGEYMYGFRKDSKLYPVTTFILYSGEDDWTGPTCLHDMLDFTDIPESLRKMVPNYKINVIHTRKIEDTSVFKTDLRQVLEFLKCKEDKQKLSQLVQNDLYFQNMEEDAYDVVACYGDVEDLLAKKEYHMKEGKVNMCRAIREMLEDERAEGREEGREEGRTEGNVSGIIKTARRYHASDEEIIQQLMEELEIDKDKAREYLKNEKKTRI